MRGGVDFKFFDAVTPNTIKDFYSIIPALQYNTKLSWGEKACLMSHARLWQKCYEENIPCMGIFEDDVVLGNNAFLFLKDSDWLQKRFASQAVIVRLETSLQRANLNETHISPIEHLRFMELKNSLAGAAGYIINTAAAKLLLDDVKKISINNPNEAKAADWVIFENMLNRNDIKVYQVFPAVCIQDQLLPKNNSLGSSLEIERSQYHKDNPFPKKRKTLIQWLKYIFTTPQRKYRKFKRVSIPFEE